jgi:hypothetical protein
MVCDLDHDSRRPGFPEEDSVHEVEGLPGKHAGPRDRDDVGSARHHVLTVRPGVAEVSKRLSEGTVGAPRIAPPYDASVSPVSSRSSAGKDAVSLAGREESAAVSQHARATPGVVEVSSRLFSGTVGVPRKPSLDTAAQLLSERLRAPKLPVSLHGREDMASAVQHAFNAAPGMTGISNRSASDIVGVPGRKPSAD